LFAVVGIVKHALLAGSLDVPKLLYALGMDLASGAVAQNAAIEARLLKGHWNRILSKEKARRERG
jgi:hypothetical protein